MTTRRGLRLAFPWLALALVGPAAVLLVPLPKGTRLAGVALDLGHVVLGVVVCLVLARALGLRGRRLTRGAWAWLGTMLVLGGLELAQAISDRMPSVEDMVANGLGATAGLLFLVWPRTRGMARRLAVAAIPVVIALIPTGLHVWDTLRQGREFPVLAGFETQLEMMRWRFEGARGRRTTAAADGHHALEVTLQPGDWPGALLAHPHPDWRGYTTLAFELHTEQARTLLLNVVDRAHDGDYADRFTRKLELAAGWNAVRIALADIERGPHARKLDLSRVHALQWFADHPKTALTFRLDAIRLE